MGVLLVFGVSLIICCAIAYMLGLLWFSDIRNRRFRSFFLLGIEVFFWTLLNAIGMVSSTAYFPLIYTLRTVFASIVPFGVAWFILDFTGSSLQHKRWVQSIALAVPALDVLCILTNPWHHLYFVNYDFPFPLRAPLFALHSAVHFVVIAAAFILLLRHIIKGAKDNPILILTGVGMLVPYALNLLYGSDLIPFRHDLSPIGFFLMLFLFVLCCYHFQLFNIKIALFSSTMDAIGDVIVLFNQNRVVIDANRQAARTFRAVPLRTGRTKSDALFDYLGQAAGDETSSGLVEGLKTLAYMEGECSMVLPGGKVRSYNLHWQSVYEGKKKSGYILVMTDVSNYRNMIREINEQNQMLVDLKEAAEAASNAKGEFLSRMSHEMRTPMNAVIGMTQVALRNDGLTQSLHATLLKIEGASNHLLGVINDVLDMSKIESGKLTLTESVFSMEEFLQKISALADIHTQQKGQRFSIVIGEDVPPAILVDGQRLTQVVTNLLSNAFKFTPEGGEVLLSIQREPKKEIGVAALRFSVKDSGIGIPPEKQGHLFKPFEQADGSISRDFGGTGLGLAISRNIVEMMGGQIGLVSSPGSGSCFTFTICVKISETAPGREPEAVPQNNVQPDTDNEFENCRILLAEDMEINREIVMALLEGSGVAFDTAENGRIALEKYKENPGRYDMIFMDVQMPEMDGLAATGAIRATDFQSAATIPIIAMTANAFKEDVDLCLAAGMNDHIAKPIDIDVVRNMIRRYYYSH